MMKLLYCKTIRNLSFIIFDKALIVINIELQTRTSIHRKVNKHCEYLINLSMALVFYLYSYVLMPSGTKKLGAIHIDNLDFEQSHRVGWRFHISARLFRYELWRLNIFGLLEYNGWSTKSTIVSTGLGKTFGLIKKLISQ